MTKGLALFFAFFLSTTAMAAQTKPIPAEEIKKFQKCDDPADCIRLDNGCCDCANGGDTVAINRKHEKAFRERFDCKKTICTQRAGDCVFREPDCVNSACVLGPQKQRFPKK